MNRHLRALLIVGGIAALTWVGTALYLENKSQNAGAGKDNPTASVQLNQPVPGFESKDLAGKSISLAQFQGKVVIVNFWASWCGPCVEEMPSLLKLLKTFPEDLVLVAISGDSTMEDLESFMKSFPEMRTLANSHVVWDSEKTLTQQYKIYRLPESFVLDKEMKLVKKISGTIDWHTPDAIEYVKKLINP